MTTYDEWVDHQQLERQPCLPNISECPLITLITSTRSLLDFNDNDALRRPASEEVI